MRYPAIDTNERYTDAAGVEHLIVIELDYGGAWCVLDVTADDCRLVERLAGHDDGDEQVAALVEQYVEAARAYAAGNRQLMPSSDPLPNAEFRPCPANISRPGRRGEPLRLPLAVQEHPAA